MNTIKSLTIIILLSILFGCSEENMLDNSILNKKPVFVLKLHSYGTRYNTYINGVMVYRDGDGRGQVTTSLPINHWLKSGDNTFELLVYPDKKDTNINEKSTIQVEIFIHNDGQEDQLFRIGGFEFKGVGHINNIDLKGYQLEAAEFKVSDSGGVSVSNTSIEEYDKYSGAYKYSKIISMPNSLPLWAFFNSDDVPNDPDLSEEEYWTLSAELRDHLKVIQNKIIAGDIDEVMPIFEERNKELDKAFYYSSGVMEAKLRDSFEVDISQLNMLEIEGRDVSYVNEDNLKLASIFRTKRGAAMVGNFIDSQGSIEFPIMFRKQDGKWIITR
jgi:hypothetical protein